MLKKLLSISLAILLLCGVLVSCDKKEDIELGNVLIFGDSYSTFAGVIPEGYASWYSPDIAEDNVDKASETWWQQLIDRTHSKLLLNSSYSGSTICHTGYDGADVADISFVGRMTALFADDTFDKESVDTVFIYGGLNDYWAQAPLGELKYDGFTPEDLYSVYPAFSYLLLGIKENLPEARVIVIIEEYLSEDMQGNMAAACEHLGVEYIKPENISKEYSHPDEDGMDAITDQIIDYLNNDSIK